MNSYSDHLEAAAGVDAELAPGVGAHLEVGPHPAVVGVLVASRLAHDRGPRYDVQPSHRPKSPPPRPGPHAGRALPGPGNVPDVLYRERVVNPRGRCVRDEAAHVAGVARVHGPAGRARVLAARELQRGPVPARVEPEVRAQHGVVPRCVGRGSGKQQTAREERAEPAPAGEDGERTPRVQLGAQCVGQSVGARAEEPCAPPPPAAGQLQSAQYRHRLVSDRLADAPRVEEPERLEIARLAEPAEPEYLVPLDEERPPFTQERRVARDVEAVRVGLDLGEVRQGGRIQGCLRRDIPLHVEAGRRLQLGVARPVLVAADVAFGQQFEVESLRARLDAQESAVPGYLDTAFALPAFGPYYVLVLARD